MPKALLPDAPARYGEAWELGLQDLGLRIFQPVERLPLPEWSEKFRRWRDESPYRIAQTPYVREVMEAYQDPAIEEIVIVKPSQSGLTEGFLVNAIGYHMDQDPRDILVVVPSVDEAKKWSRKKLQPMIDATPRVQGKLEDSSRSSAATMQEKSFPGGSLSIVGSNSGRGFRMVTIGTVLSDDVEGWDATAGKGANSEGDQVTLIRRRTDRIPDRKRVWISTPRLAGGRIHQLYQGTERRGEWRVPCPHCGEMQPLLFGGPEESFGIKWEKRTVSKSHTPKPGEILRGTTLHLPDTAHYVCAANGCRIEESSKIEMESRGEWLAEDGLPVRRPGVRSIGLWMRGALTITLPGSEWPRVVREFLEVKDYPGKLMAWQNTVLAKVWEDRGEAPEWRRLYERRESYDRGTCPDGVEFVTVGVDVQESWIEGHAWGWGYDRERWFLEHVVSDGSPRHRETWAPITELLHRRFPAAGGRELPVAGLAVDTGHDQTSVVAWAYSVGDRRIMLVKGDHWKNWRVIVGTPSKSEVTISGKKTGLMLWPVGGALIKQELYGFLELSPPLDSDPFPPGWVHLPDWVDERWLRGLVSEDLVTTTDRHGFTKREWVKNTTRNEPLDGCVYARAAAERAGLSRLRRPTESEAPKRRDSGGDDGGPGSRDGWLGRGSGGRGRRRGRWLR